MYRPIDICGYPQFIADIDQIWACPGCQWHKSLAAVCLAGVAARLWRSECNSSLWRLVGTCRSTKCIFRDQYLRQAHRVRLCPLKSHGPPQPGLRASGPLVRASVGIVDEASSGTINSAQPQRNPTYRPSSKNNRHKPFNLPSSLTHITHMHCQQKSGSSSAPPTPT